MRKFKQDGPTRPRPNILLPQHAGSDIQKLIADFCESLRKKEAYCLGFIPAVAYTDAQIRGRLFVELENDEPVGFCLWATRKSILRIHQTAVVEDARRIKHATSIVTQVLSSTAGKRAKELRVRVADDLPANGFWKSIGCKIEQTQPGGKTWNRTINIYSLKLKDKMKVAAGIIDANLAAMQRDLAK